MQASTNKVVDTALKSLAEDGQLSIHISGSCMMPLIKNGALVEVCKQDLYWPGDILVKRCLNGQLIAHRLIGYYPRRGKLYLVTRADNAAKADASIESSQIIGRVSGGQCADTASSIPLLYRISAIGQFTYLLIQRLAIRFLWGQNP